MNEFEPKINLRIKNFRSLEDITVELRPLIFLFGPNGSGKSTFTKALRFLSHNLFNLYDDLYHHDIKPETRKYVIDKETDLMSFKEIVKDNDLSKSIYFEITVENVIIDYTPLKKILEATSFDERLSDLKPDYLDPIPNERIDISLIFEFSCDETQKEKISISINDLKNDLSYSFIPNSRRVDDNPYLLNSSFSLPSDLQFSETIESLVKDHYFIPFISSTDGFEKFYFQKDLLIAQIEELAMQEEINEWNVSEIFYNTLHIVYKIGYEIPRIVKEHFSPLIHLPPLREKPKHFYFLQGGLISKDEYYGIPSMFQRNIDGLHEKIYGGITGGDLGSNSLEPFVDWHWYEPHAVIINKMLNKLGLAEQIILKEDTEKLVGWLIYTSIDGKSQSNLAEASSGLLQVLPIISIIIREETEGALIVIEQPELHLHPKLQANLAELFASKNFSSKNLIIETHSEHMIRKIQVLIAKGAIEKNGLVVYYFDKDEKKGTTSIQEMQLEDNGFFKEPWPNGFFDDSYNLTKELLRANKN